MGDNTVNENFIDNRFLGFGIREHKRPLKKKKAWETAVNWMKTLRPTPFDWTRINQWKRKTRNSRANTALLLSLLRLVVNWSLRRSSAIRASSVGYCSSNMGRLGGQSSSRARHSSRGSADHYIRGLSLNHLVMSSVPDFRSHGRSCILTDG